MEPARRSVSSIQPAYTIHSQRKMTEDYTALRRLLSVAPKDTIQSAFAKKSMAEKRHVSNNDKITTNEVQSAVVNSNDQQQPKNGNGYSHLSKKKAAFEQWHKRKLSEIEQKCSTISQSTSELANKTSPKRLCQKPMMESAKETPNEQQSSSIILQLISKPLTLIPVQEKALATTVTTAQSCDTSSFNKSLWSNSYRTSNEDLIAPKLSRHNDAAFYPNIQCILCKEWVCSRNRYMHIESHLQYRPYRCNVCNYDNRKKIFIELHINRVHRGTGSIIYNPDTELEKRAWAIAEQCLQHTREVLLTCSKIITNKKSGDRQPSSNEKMDDEIRASSKEVDTNFSRPFLSTYEEVYRPNIYNNQRKGKSLLIEQSRQLGLIPDFSEVLSREECCRICRSYILRNHSLLEEHVRGHLSEPSYACTFSDCSVVHSSKNFIYRHMKEVHRARKPVRDLLEDVNLQAEFVNLCRASFPDYYLNTVNLGRRRISAEIAANQGKEFSSADPSTESTVADTTCYGCEIGFILFRQDQDDSEDRQCLECISQKMSGGGSSSTGRLICNLCCKFVKGDSASVQWHSLEHCRTAPFSCSLCPFSSYNPRSVMKHINSHHQLSSDCLSAKKFIRFKWEELEQDWRSMWMQMCRCCYERKDPLATIQDHQTLITKAVEDLRLPGSATRSFYCTCTLCLSLVIGDYWVLFDHSRKHMSRTTFACSYCQYKSETGAEILEHTKRVHPRNVVLMCSDVTKESMDERNLLLSLCFPEVPPLQWAHSGPGFGDLGLFNPAGGPPGLFPLAQNLSTKRDVKVKNSKD